jgi:hypothetical protein
MTETCNESGCGAFINHVNPGNTSKIKKVLLSWFSGTLHTSRRSDQIMHCLMLLASPLNALIASSFRLALAVCGWHN